MVVPVSEPVPVTQPRRGRCCISCGVFLIVCMVMTVIATWLAARWLESSGAIDKMVAEDSGPGSSISSRVGIAQPMSEKWMQYLSLRMSEDGRVAVGVAMPRFSMVTMLRNPPPTALNPAAGQQKTQAWAQQLLTPRLVIYDMSTSSERELPVDFGMPAMLAGEVAVSRDGRLAAVELRKPMEPGEKAESDDVKPLGLWAVDLQTGKPTRLADAGQPLRWSPDGRLVAYEFYDQDKERRQIWAAGPGVAPKLMLDTAVEGVRWSADGRMLLALVSGPEVEGRPPDHAVVQADVNTGTTRQVPVVMSRARRPQALGRSILVRCFTFKGGPGKDKRVMTGQVAAVDLQSAQGFWVGKPFPGSVSVVGQTLGGRHVVVEPRGSAAFASRLHAVSVADGRFRPLLAEEGKPEGRVGSIGHVAAERDGRTVLLPVGPGSDDFAKMMVSVFFGSGFGETLWRLDLDEAKLRATAGSDTPARPAEG